MLDGRQPTANETSAHEARLLAIHNTRGNKTDELLRREAILAGWKPRGLRVHTFGYGIPGLGGDKRS
jgi:hypothetical protein